MTTRPSHRCDACGHRSSRWLGRCPACGAWNTFREETIAPRATRGGERPTPVRLRDLDGTGEPRLTTGCGELDRVLGGGLVAGSAVLIGGEPGVGKSTLMLQMAHALARRVAVLYVTGEESPAQLGLRAERLELTDSAVELLATGDLEVVEAELLRTAPRVAVIDSIQTLRTAEAEGAPGGLSQVRACAGRLCELAKRTGTAILLVGHVTKGGALAGPKVLEHMVDAVLLFEGERTQALQVLRATKNRYGSTNEVGLFEMRSTGLADVERPEQRLLGERPEAVAGAVTSCVLEGNRILPVEIQALVAPTIYAAPRRVANGLDLNRLHLILAVMEQHAGRRTGQQDVYVNVVGGLRVTEPAVDLAVAIAVASSMMDKPVPTDTMIFGEIGLTGEVRTVQQTDRRLAEARRLGLATIILPAGREAAGPGCRGVRRLRDALASVMDGAERGTAE